jgi:hypothetical protein
MNKHRLQGRRVVIGGYGGALAAAVLALALAACTRTMSLGAAGMPDGSDVHASTDAGDARPDLPPDAQPDRAPDVAADTASDIVVDTAPDVPGDSHNDQNVDGGKSCVDNGITYHSGDVVLCPGYPVSCVCTDGTVGDCSSGMGCPVDGSIVIDPVPVATITKGGTISPGIQVIVDSRGAAQRTIPNPGALVTTPPPPGSFPPGAPEVTLFLYHLQRVGDLTRLTAACPDAASNSIAVHLLSGSGVTSSDFGCPLVNPTPDSLALVQDIHALLGIDDSNNPSNDSINAQACTTTGGHVENNLCCTGASNFPDSCGVGACSCSPTNLKVVDTCVCPSGACFLPSAGCVGPANVCTVGADQSCNDNPGTNAFHGTCVTGGHCLCHTGFTIVAASGKCS